MWLSRGSALLRPLVKVLRLGLGCLSSVSVLRLGLGLVTGGWPRLYELSWRGSGDHSGPGGLTLASSSGLRSPASGGPGLSPVLTMLEVKELSLISRDSSREPDWSLEGGSCQDEAATEWRKDDRSCK